MPSGPPELHAKFCSMDPAEGCGDRAAIAFLKGRGYELLKSWFWRRPSDGRDPTEDENEALNYLFWEWDFGGLEGEGSVPYGDYL